MLWVLVYYFDRSFYRLRDRGRNKETKGRSSGQTTFTIITKINKTASPTKKPLFLTQRKYFTFFFNVLPLLAFRTNCHVPNPYLLVLNCHLLELVLQLWKSVEPFPPFHYVCKVPCLPRGHWTQRGVHWLTNYLHNSTKFVDNSFIDILITVRCRISYKASRRWSRT